MNEHFSRWMADRIPAYLDGRRADLEALHRALTEGDLSSIQDLAHKMKGTGSAYGFPEITEIGDRMETAAKAGNRTEICTWISALSECLDGIKKSRANTADDSEAGSESGPIVRGHHLEGRRP